MKLANILFLAVTLLAVTSAQAGTIHPALQAKMDQVRADEPISFFVHLTEQAPMAELELQLTSQQDHFCRVWRSTGQELTGRLNKFVGIIKNYIITGSTT